MIPLIVTPDLRQSCRHHFPGDMPCVEPHSAVSTGATLRADYRCPCGAEWSCWWDARAAQWPVYREEAA